MADWIPESMAELSIRQTPLGMALAQAIAERGPITFAAYMQIALYDPVAGYYAGGARNRATRQQRVGWEGDFITSADLHPLFGAAIGRKLAQIWTILECPHPFVVHEDGAGRGLLARDVLAWARRDDGGAPSGFAEALIYRMRDVADTPSGTRQWLAEPHADLAVMDLPPQVILSNELIDAFPVHVVERGADGWAEVYVDAQESPPYLREILGPPVEGVVAYLERYDVRWQALPLGWRGEVCLQAEEWMVDAAQRLAPRGCVITIDYGDTAPQLYTPERPKGTLICYRAHTLSEHPLAFTGEQDITAHVNFSALVDAGQRAGLSVAELATQRDFLLLLGLRDDAERLARQLFPKADIERHTDDGQRDYLRRASLRNRVAALLDPAGLGGFRVLVQQRGLAENEGA
jgi:SAM-dependent MidA family methyltransferase